MSITRRNLQNCQKIGTTIKVEARIIEVSGEEVRYQKISNLNGPVFVAKISEILTIIYDNGEVQTFETETKTSVPEDVHPTTNNTTHLYNSGYGPHLQAIMSVGANFMETHAGPSGVLIYGSRIRDYIFVGGGIGVHTLLRDKNNVEDHNLAIAFYANPRAYLPVKENFMPFVDWHVGFQVAGYGMQDGRGRGYWTVLFFTKVGMGFEIKKFNLSLGYEYLLGAHTGYVSIGIALP